ncbi:MAG: flagellar export protein FliJ [Planctomycetes bacterium]|nr:flagellar export protein FliJ [Planctomycetota bacterium]
MKRFRFKFERLRKLREQDERSALLLLALAQENLAREERILTDLVGAVADSGLCLWGLIKEGAAPEMLRNADVFRRATSDAAARQSGLVGLAAKEAGQKRGEFDASRRKAEAIRKLHEKKREEHRKEFLKEMQKELDEIGGRGNKAAV